MNDNNGAVTPDEILGCAGRKPPQPVCPYCDADPVFPQVTMVKFPAGGAVAAVFFCDKCRKVLSVAPLGVAPQQEPSRILRAM